MCDLSQPLTPAMAQYAVLWTDSADPRPLWVGSLDVSSDHLLLRGANGHDDVELAIPVESVKHVRRAGTVERIDGYPSLSLELQPARRLIITSLTGAGVISELLDTLLRLLPLA